MTTNWTTFQIDAVLRRLAHRQLGLVTVAQAEQAGLGRWVLERRREAGALAPMFADVMRLTSVPTTPQHRYLGAALAIPGDVVSATSAAVVHGMPVRPPH